MNYRPSDSYVKEFTTANPTTGAAADADSLPVATANRNGADDGTWTLTVTKIDTGRYKATGTVPSGYAANDIVNITVAATCSTVAGKACIDTFYVVSKRSGDVTQVVASVSGAVASVTGSVGSVTGAVGSVTGAVASVTGAVGSVTAAITLPTIPTDWIAGAGVKADAVTKIQSGLALATQIPANFTTATFASAGVFATAALANAPTGGSAPTAAANAAAVWDLATTGHTTAGTFGSAMNAAGSTGDPWSTSLPGSYGAGTAGFKVGTNLDATVSSRSTFAGGNVTLDLTQVLSAARDVSAIADTSITLNDVFHCAAAGAAGKETVVGTTYTVKTPSTGTVLRIFTLDSGSAPTSRT